jgi:D-alanyl-D-alanine-carboxypeptidase/D-alanyl-D-alanine-endopeptidase
MIVEPAITLIKRSKIMLKSLFQSVILLLLLQVVAFAQNPFNQAEFDDYIQIRMETEKTPSITIALSDSDGNVTFNNYGTFSFTDNRSADENSLYEIGSITKSFTGLLMQILMAEHGISGDTPVTDLLKNDKALPTLNDKSITINHLLSHTSSLPRLPGNMSPASMDDPYKEYTIDQLYRYLSAVEITREPGSEFEYSNMAFMLLGNLAEKIGGAPYDELVKTYITGPLGMNSTSRLVADETRLVAPTASGAVVPQWNMDHTRGFGELRSTTTDLIKLMQAGTGHLPYEYAKAFTQSREKQLTIRDNFGMALGWFIATNHQDTIVFHGGGTGGFRTFAGYSPVTGISAVVFANSNDDVQDIGRYLINNAYTMRKIDPIAKLTEDQLSRLTGRYTNPGVPAFHIEVDGTNISARMEGQPALPLTPVTDLKFRNSTVQAEIHFEIENDQGFKLTLVQAGNRIEFERDFDYIATESDPNTRPTPDELIEIQLPVETLNEYVGTYHHPMGISYEFSVLDDALMAKLTGQSQFQVHAYAQDKFFYRIVDAQLEFQRDDAGNVVGVVLYQGGQVLQFDRSN